MNHIELIIEVGRTKGIAISYKFLKREEKQRVEINTIELLLNIDVIQLVNTLFDSPEDFSTISFIYEEKEYQLLPESLVSLRLLDIINVLEKRFIIDKTLIEIYDNEKNEIVKERL